MELRTSDQPIIEDEISAVFMEFFDAFIWEDYQKEGVTYPITVGGKVIKSAQDWAFINLFPSEDYFLILNPDELFVFDTAGVVKEVKMCIVDFDSKTALDFLFRKNQKQWKLTKLTDRPYVKMPEKEFIDFLTKFAADSVFQLQHILFPLSAVTLDGDYEVYESTIEKKNWKYLNLIGGTDKIVIFQSSRITPDTRLLHLRGIDNGFQILVAFEKSDNQWKLVKLEDYSM